MVLTMLYQSLERETSTNEAATAVSKHSVKLVTRQQVHGPLWSDLTDKESDGFLKI